MVGKRLELFAFIEVDDRRNTKTCHVFMCEKGVKNAALRICEAVCKAFEDAVEDAKKRAGNPLLPMDKVRDVVEGPLASLQVPRKDLVAIKAIGKHCTSPRTLSLRVARSVPWPWSLPPSHVPPRYSTIPPPPPDGLAH